MKNLLIVFSAAFSLMSVSYCAIPYYKISHLRINNGLTHQRKVRQVQRDLSYRWPQNTVPYFIGNVTNAVKKSVGMAISELETKTCIRFQKVDDAYDGISKAESYGLTFALTENNWNGGDSVRIVDLGACSSPIGRQQIGVQDVSLAKNCWGMGTAIHELMHAVGIEHTQSRSDRNQYLDINVQNIDRQDLPNFELLSPRLWANLVPYDYGSVMHYSADSFSNKNDAQTMLPKDRSFIETMGSMIPNFYDFDQINRYYECNEKCPNSPTTANCANGGTPNPNNCQVCICPMGYGGDLCNQRPPGCGSTLIASSQFQKQKLSLKFDKKDDQYFTFCNFWIIAPTNRSIQMIYEITSEATRKAICEFGCYDGGIEVKHLPDPRITNDRDCCLDIPLNVTSPVNPLPVIVYTSGPSITYDVTFRFV